ncbi:MAG TPA: ABC transporter ATP-binding protein [Ilumatobacteraceae bacterium]|nr:ABC transporter ATP-binding protein [Ilumatobacteraceae bacterium]
MHLLEASGLVKRFGGVAAVNNVTFSVPSGQWLGIIGPNGAGKSTLFNLLGGQLHPTEGSIRFADADITKLTPHQRFHLGVGRSFQITSLFQGLSVVDHMALALRRHGRRSIVRPSLGDRSLLAEVSDVLAAWDLAGVASGTLPDELSYGEQRRLELALAIASEPKLLLLDEPNVGLTSSECDELLTKVRKIAHDVTVVFVAHDMEMVLGWSHRVLVMHFGELIADETPEELLHNEFVGEVYLGTKVENPDAGTD